MRRGYPTRRDRQRPAQDPPPRPGEDPALAATRAGVSGDLGLAAGPLRPLGLDQPSRRRRGPRSRPNFLHPGPAHRPPYRHRYRGLFPLRTGTTPCPTSWPTSPPNSTRPGGTGAVPARSNEPATTATESKDPTTATPATPDHPPSTSEESHAKQHDQLKLRGIGPRPLLRTSSTPFFAMCSTAAGSSPERPAGSNTSTSRTASLQFPRTH